LQKKEVKVSASECSSRRDNTRGVSSYEVSMRIDAMYSKPSPSAGYNLSKKEPMAQTKPKPQRKKFYESSSSEEDDEEIARRIALRKASKQTDPASKTSKFTVDSDSDSSTDFVAKRRAAKKKNEGTCNMNGAFNTSMCQGEESEEFTQKISNVSPSKSSLTDTKQKLNDSELMNSSDEMTCVLEESSNAVDGLQTQNEKATYYDAQKVTFDTEQKPSPAKHVSSDKQSTPTRNDRTPVSDIIFGHTEQKRASINKTTPVNEQIAIDLTDDSPAKERSSNRDDVYRSFSVVGTVKGSENSSQLKQSTLQSSLKTTSTRNFVAASASASDVSHENNSDPIIADHTATPSNVQWSVHKQCLIVRTAQGNTPDSAPRIKVASFDLDDTLVIWRCSGWPSRPEHYELWSGSVISKMQKLHDEGYKLVIFSNQGGIRGAFQGKNATRIKSVIDWIADLVDRPLFAVCSTKKDGGYHKGNPGMWTVMEDVCNGGVKAKPELSFFVGDADGAGENAGDAKQQQYQVEGVDKLFAENVGKLRNVTMEFFNPNEYFGKSNADKRKVEATIGSPLQFTKEAMVTRAALLGEYLSSKVLLVMVGVQGSGKTTLCQYLTEGNSDWCHYSQDTISNGGKPGKREAVEAAAIASLKEGKNVVIDRMHLDSDQRRHFIKLGKQCNVPVHCLVMLASKEDVRERVTNRTNHPGKVERVHGARIAVASLDKLTMPSYEEGFDLISYSYEIDGLLPTAYRCLSNDNCRTSRNGFRNVKLYNSATVALPMVTFGTMKLGKKSTQGAVSRAMHLCIRSIDTAPTYDNEHQVGLALTTNTSSNVIVTIKVPKRVITPAEARSEVLNSLKLLGCSCADIALIHWPCDLIEAGSLQSVWQELESMKSEGICKTIGVANFSIGALMHLLSTCHVKPAINQVERHPLLPQYDLLEYCQSQGIVVQAHTSLGHANKSLLKNNAILQVANDSGLTAAQVLLLWNIQQGVPIVTKFSTEEHGQDIVPILQSKIKLTPQHMKTIDEIGLSIEAGTRLVAPPFMYKSGASYSWGDGPPPK
jgi:DNA 3'-phosphatase